MSSPFVYTIYKSSTTRGGDNYMARRKKNLVTPYYQPTQPQQAPILPYEPADIPSLALDARDLHLYTTDARVLAALREIIEEDNRYLYGRYARRYSTPYDPRGVKKLSLLCLLHQMVSGEMILPEKD